MFKNHSNSIKKYWTIGVWWTDGFKCWTYFLFKYWTCFSNLKFEQKSLRLFRSVMILETFRIKYVRRWSKHAGWCAFVCKCTGFWYAKHVCYDISIHIHSIRTYFEATRICMELNCLYSDVICWIHGHFPDGLRRHSNRRVLENAGTPIRNSNILRGACTV